MTRRNRWMRQQGYDRSASEEEKDYASVLANARSFPSTAEVHLYCGHCKPCVENLDIAMINKFYDLATMQRRRSRRRSSPTMNSWTIRHLECIGCHACESSCPFWSSDRGADGEDCEVIWVLALTKPLRYSLARTGNRIYNKQVHFGQIRKEGRKSICGFGLH